MKIALFLAVLFLANPLMGQSMTGTDTAFVHSFNAMDGSAVSLGAYAGKVILVVNTASQCGFTPQYRDLQTLHDTYKDKGLVVIGVPSDNFGGQEPGSNEDIKQFTQEKFQVSFLLMAKTDVVGKGAHPFYDWAARQENSGLLGARPRWNFHKFLIGKNGALLGSYLSTVSPMSPTITSAIETALAE